VENKSQLPALEKFEIIETFQDLNENQESELLPEAEPPTSVYQSTICKSAERGKRESQERWKRAVAASPEVKSSLERAEQNPKNQSSLFGYDVASKITLQNMAVLNKSFNRKKPLDAGSVRGARAASTTAERKARSYASNQKYKEQLRAQASNFQATSASNAILPPAAPPAEKQ
jgi:hypothetical protein